MRALTAERALYSAWTMWRSDPPGHTTLLVDALLTVAERSGQSARTQTQVAKKTADLIDHASSIAGGWTPPDLLPVLLTRATRLQP